MNYLYYIYNFFIYSFIGWLIEEVYSYTLCGHFKEDGFLFGPIKPMYGIAMVVIIFVIINFNFSNLEKSIIIFFVPAVVEYISGYILRNFLHKQYWSYQDNRFNLNGLICLKFCIYWFILIIIGLKTIFPLTELYYMKYSKAINTVLPLLTVFILSDLSITIRKILYKKII